MNYYLMPVAIAAIAYVVWALRKINQIIAKAVEHEKRLLARHQRLTTIDKDSK